MTALLEVRDLSVRFDTETGSFLAVEDVDLTLERGRTLGLVGESGCGKSVTSLAIMRLVPSPPGRVRAKGIFFKGRNLLELPESEMRRLRGSALAMIFQEPMTALNPVFTVGDQVMEAVRRHRRVSRAVARDAALEAFESVGIPAPRRRLRDYPHQLSGGLRQRVMIAMALACSPELLIADEPTTALDVTVQAQILHLLRELQQRRDLSLLLITHDLGVVAELAHHVAVMYAGAIVEYGPTERLYRQPRHPYTRALWRCLPRIAAAGERRARARLPAIEGAVPDPRARPEGCPFRPRCTRASARCREPIPVLPLPQGGWVRCIHPEEPRT